MRNLSLDPLPGARWGAPDPALRLSRAACAAIFEDAAGGPPPLALAPAPPAALPAAADLALVAARTGEGILGSEAPVLPPLAAAEGDGPRGGEGASFTEWLRCVARRVAGGTRRDAPLPNTAAPLPFRCSVALQRWSRDAGLPGYGRPVAPVPGRGTPAPSSHLFGASAASFASSASGGSLELADGASGGLDGLAILPPPPSVPRTTSAWSAASGGGSGRASGIGAFDDSACASASGGARAASAMQVTGDALTPSALSPRILTRPGFDDTAASLRSRLNGGADSVLSGSVGVGCDLSGSAFPCASPPPLGQHAPSQLATPRLPGALSAARTGRAATSSPEPPAAGGLSKTALATPRDSEARISDTACFPHCPLPAAALAPLRAAIVMWGFDDVLVLMLQPPSAAAELLQQQRPRTALRVALRSPPSTGSAAAPPAPAAAAMSPRAVMALEKAVLLLPARAPPPPRHDAAALARAVTLRVSALIADAAGREEAAQGREAAAYSSRSGGTAGSSCEEPEQGSGRRPSPPPRQPFTTGTLPSVTGHPSAGSASHVPPILRVPAAGSLEAEVTGLSAAATASEVDSGRSAASAPAGGAGDRRALASARPASSALPRLASLATLAPALRAALGGLQQQQAPAQWRRGPTLAGAPTTLAPAVVISDSNFAADRVLDLTLLPLSLAAPLRPAASTATASQLLRKAPADGSTPGGSAPALPVPASGSRVLRYDAGADAPSLEALPSAGAPAAAGDAAPPPAGRGSPFQSRAAQAADAALDAAVTDMMRATPRRTPRAPFDARTARLIGDDEQRSQGGRARSSASLAAAQQQQGGGTPEVLVVRRLPPLLIQASGEAEGGRSCVPDLLPPPRCRRRRLQRRRRRSQRRRRLTGSGASAAPAPLPRGACPQSRGTPTGSTRRARARRRAFGAPAAAAAVGSGGARGRGGEAARRSPRACRPRRRRCRGSSRRQRSCWLPLRRGSCASRQLRLLPVARCEVMALRKPARQINSISQPFRLSFQPNLSILRMTSISSDAAPLSTVIALLCGLPASGKSTIARCLASQVRESDLRIETVIFDDILDRELGDAPWSPAAWHRARLALTEVCRALVARDARPGGRLLVLVEDNFELRSMRRELFDVAQSCKCAVSDPNNAGKCASLGSSSLDSSLRFCCN